MIEGIENPNEYLRGQIDCKKGKPAEIGAHTDYYRGYEKYYEWEQCMTEQNLNQDKRMSLFQ